MTTREIVRSDWPEFFDSFTHAHSGWLATLEVIGIDVGAQVEARELPLEGVSADPHEPTVWLSLGKDPASHVTHRIDHVKRVRLQQTDEGADEALQIEGADDVMTLVRFRTAVRSDHVDGVAR